MSEYYTAKLSNSALASHVSIDDGAVRINELCLGDKKI